MRNLLIKDINSLYKGYYKVCDAVAETFGGEGKLALLENSTREHAPNTTKDGVSVALSIRFNDKFTNFGALAAIQAASQTLEKSGDSTTTCLIFAQGFLRNIDKNRFNKKVEAGINIGFDEVVEQIKSLKQDVNRDILVKIATTSANNDQELGSKIVEAYDKVGVNGIVDVIKDYDSTQVKILTKNGMKISKGYSSPHFINNNNKAIWEGRDVIVACLETWQSDDKIIDFIKVNRKRADESLQPILIFMEKDNSDFKERLITLNKANNTDICLVIAPDGHNELMCTTNIKDLALFTDGEAYHPSNDKVIFGTADYVSVDSTETIITKSKVSKDVIAKIVDLKAQEKQDNYTRQRIQRLEAVSCTISIGGNSTNDIDEIYDRVEDAMSSVKTASKDGFIAGGGTTLMYIHHRMNKVLLNKDQQLGYDLVKKVLVEPSLRIVKNANRKHSSNKLSQFLFGAKDYLTTPKFKYGLGYNAKTDEISNLIDDGVIDSAKSIIVALSSAKDSAVKMLLTNVVVTFPDPKKWWEDISFGI